MGENNHSSKLLFAIVFCIAGVTSTALPVMGVSPCDPYWSPNAFGATGANDTVYAVVQFDPDGDGPQEAAVIVGGGFSSIGATSSLNKIARRDGVDWAPMGTGLGSTCFALTLFDEDGLGPNPARLFAGGAFTTAGGVSANRIARWNGANWSSVGSGLNGDVHALTVFDADGDGPGAPALYAGGRFTTAGGGSALHVARWTGSAWQAVGTGVGAIDPEDVVTSLSVFDEDGDGPNPPRLFAGGHFFVSGAQQTNFIARWNGSSWTDVGGGLWSNYTIPPVQDMVVHDDDGPGPNPAALFVFGNFNTAGGLSVENVAKWDGASWHDVGGGIPADPEPSYLYTAAVIDEDGDGPGVATLFVGGAFYYDAPEGFTDGIVKWDGTEWHKVSNGAGGEAIRVLKAIDEDGDGSAHAMLYAGGDFDSINGIGANRLARFDGADWSLLVGTGGLNERVNALLRFDEDGAGPMPEYLFAGGRFVTGGATQIKGIGKWDGTTWLPVGGGVTWPGLATQPSVTALGTYDDDGGGPNPHSLVVGGPFSKAGSISVNGIARWDGVDWYALGGGFTTVGIPGAGRPGIRAITEFDPDGAGSMPSRLIVGGNFNRADGQVVKAIAQWDGIGWTSLGSGVQNNTCSPDCTEVSALAVFDVDGPGPLSADLFVAGNFHTAGGLNAPSLARWDGQNWFPVATHSVTVNQMVVFDDDGDGPGGPALFVGGIIGSINGVTVGGLAKWDGSNWSAPLNSPFLSQSRETTALLVWDEDGPSGPQPESLYVATSFSQNYLVYKWDRINWTTIGNASWLVRSMSHFGGDGTAADLDDLYIGGYFTSVSSTYSSYMARYERPYGFKNGDMNYDGRVDGNDVQEFLDAVLISSTQPVHVCKGDFSESFELMTIGDISGFVSVLLSN
ncbi:hypothetical protein B7486_07605 [cyanobacterium TDX16]|nr:hypothetical protein B7486_07605 [cyanobacterium TDX16]